MTHHAKHLLLSVAMLVSLDAGAQARPAPAKGNASLKAEHQPPAGMCRVWIDNVPAARQPAPTDCATALRNRPNNGRVLFGPNADDRDRSRFKEKGGEEPASGRAKSGSDQAQRMREAGLCIDADRDGRCDPIPAGTDARELERLAGPGARVGSATSNVCIDRNRDGSCDETWAQGAPTVSATGTSYPRTMPEMSAALRLRRGEPSPDAQRWLGRSDLTPRYAAAAGAIPDRITWLDRNGETVQLWTDRDRDGIADRVEIHERGRRVQVIER